MTSLSCELSDWSFRWKEGDGERDEGIYKEKKVRRMEHDRNGQPNMEEFFKMLEEGFENTLENAMPDLKKFRLEISTWYYSDF